MIVEIKIPSPGESVNEVEIANWLVQEGDFVTRDQELAEVESDKATLPLIAPESGKISNLLPTGETIKVGQTACIIDTSFAKPGSQKTTTSKSTTSKKEPAEKVTKTENEPAVIVETSSATSAKKQFQNNPARKKNDGRKPSDQQ